MQDEYLSSQRCFTCQEFLVQVSPREKKCNSATCKGVVVNRDDNAQKNLRFVFEEWLKGASRPAYLSRKTPASAARGTPGSGAARTKAH